MLTKKYGELNTFMGIMIMAKITLSIFQNIKIKISAIKCERNVKKIVVLV